MLKRFHNVFIFNSDHIFDHGSGIFRTESLSDKDTPKVSNLSKIERTNSSTMPSPSTTKGIRILYKTFHGPLGVFNPGFPQEKDIVNMWLWIEEDLGNLATLLIDHWNDQGTFDLLPHDSVTKRIRKVIKRALKLKGFTSRIEDTTWQSNQEMKFSKLFDIRCKKKTNKPLETLQKEFEDDEVDEVRGFLVQKQIWTL